MSCQFGAEFDDEHYDSPRNLHRLWSASLLVRYSNAQCGSALLVSHCKPITVELKFAEMSPANAPRSEHIKNLIRRNAKCCVLVARCYDVRVMHTCRKGKETVVTERDENIHHIGELLIAESGDCCLVLTGANSFATIYDMKRNQRKDAKNELQIQEEFDKFDALWNRNRNACVVC